VTHLDEDIFHNLKNTEQRSTFVCQVLDINMEGNYKKLILSDGGYSQEALILPVGVEKIANKIKKNSIGKFSLTFKKEKNLFIIFDLIEVIYYDCPLIGHPVDFSLNQINPNKSNMIPKEIIEKKPAFQNVIQGVEKFEIPLTFEEAEMYYMKIR